MKCLVKNGNVVKMGLPSYFVRENGQAFWGGYENMTELHYEDGWRDEVVPGYDSKRQHLGEIYYDSENDICTYPIINNVIYLELEKEKLFNDLSVLKKEIAEIAMQATLTYDEQPQGLTNLLSTIRALGPIAKAEIEALTEENVLDYVLRGPQVQQLLAALKSFI